MTPATLFQILRGPFTFLRPDAEEVRRLVPDLAKTLPVPPRIFLEDEGTTPLRGFPVLVSPGLLELEKTLERYVLTEEGVQTAIQTRTPYDRKAHETAWDQYQRNLTRAIENVTLSSYGRQYPATFWLHHSWSVARLLKETPRRIVRRQAEVGRQHGDLIKYRVLERFLDRVINTCYDLVTRLAVDTEEAEEELFPRLLTRMRDNVLVFSEDHVSPDLAELGSYFNGYLRIDGRDLRHRLAELDLWHRDRLTRDPRLLDTVRHLLGEGPEIDPRSLLSRSGYPTYLATLEGYDPRRLLSREQVEIWESLLTRLKEFELFNALRRMLRPVERQGERLLSKGGGGQMHHLSAATRPMDFLAPWVVDPLVDRFGLVYDITDFSEIVSVLRRSGSEEQDLSFRKMFRFQRRINRLAAARHLTLEKYLGDGAFYSSRQATPLLAAAVQIQRYYKQELTEGFPFDRGMRIALNYGQYRLIPIGRGGADQGERYEFFGHGLVELSRLTTGKASREIDEIRTLLVTYGYPESAVHRFFAPLMQGDVDVVDRYEDARGFRAYINRNGSLINEGIVTTEAFLDRLERETPWERLYLGRNGDRVYVGVPLPDPAGETLVGVRRLGRARLKGLDRVLVYELVDGQGLVGLEEMLGRSLKGALDKLPSPGAALLESSPIAWPEDNP
jgi:hypothetical protein